MLIEILLPYLVSIITGIAGWLGGRRQSNNNFIHELQKSINLLAIENTKLLVEIVEVRKQNVIIQCELEAIKVENQKLISQIEILKQQRK